VWPGLPPPPPSLPNGEPLVARLNGDSDSTPLIRRLEGVLASLRAPGLPGCSCWLWCVCAAMVGAGGERRDGQVFRSGARPAAATPLDHHFLKTFIKQCFIAYVVLYG
jgi:hypothetical protein